MTLDTSTKVAIIGHNGFIGKHLAKRFKNFIPIGKDEVIPDCDVIYDLASYGNLYSQRDQEKIYDTNFMRVIRLFKKLKEQKYIYISSSSVKLPVLTDYALSKIAAEHCVMGRGMIVRPYTVIGVGEHKEHLIPKLIDSCLNGTEMNFDPDPVHDFIDVEDFIDNLLKVDSPLCEIGTGIGYSNESVKDIVEEVTGKKANIKEVKGLRPYDNKMWAAKEGVETKKSLKDTIIEMVNEAKNT